jgi:RNA polymerase sigma-70 factor (ECF subfamily)
MPDDALMMLAAEGRNDAFDVIVARHQPRVYSYAVRFLGDPAEGRDVTQDVFIYVWLDRHKYIPKGKFTAYLYRIKFNRCQVVARQRKRKKNREEGWFEKEGLKAKDSGEFSIRTVLRSERRRLVDEALTQLSPEMRSVLILRMTEALSYDEIVERTRLPPGTVRSHVSRGIRYIYQIVTRTGFKRNEKECLQGEQQETP